MIKLVLYTENYFPGGLERFIFDFVNSDLFDIHLIVNSENIRIIEFAKQKGISFDVVQLSRLRIESKSNNIYNNLIKVFNFIVYYLSIIPNYFKIKKLLKNLIKYENIIIVNGGYPAALSSFSTAFSANKLGFKKIGLSILSSPSPHYKNAIFKLFQLKIDNKLNKCVDFYIPNSEKIKSDLIKYINLRAEKIHVVYTGVNTVQELKKLKKLHINGRLIEKKDNDTWIAMVALLGSTKRQDILIEAISKLNSNIKLVLAGDGPNRELLEKQVDILNIRDRVIFTGWISNPHEIYLFSDLVVFISDHEGLPYSVSEAMSYKVPIIASAVGGIPEQIIDTEGGLLLEENSVSSLVEKVNYINNKNEIIEQFIDFSYKRLNSYFSVNAMNNKILELYK